MRTNDSTQAIGHKASLILVWSQKGLRRLGQILSRYRPGTLAATNSEKLSEFEIECIESQLRSIHQLEIWQAARKAYTIENVCPPRPRFLEGLLTAAEEEHVLFCKDCQDTIRSIRFRAARRWSRQLNAWRIGLVERLEGFVHRHRTVSIGALFLQLTLLVVSTYVWWNIKEVAQAPRDLAVPEVDYAIATVNHSAEQEQLLEAISQLRNELDQVKKAHLQVKTNIVRQSPGRDRFSNRIEPPTQAMESRIGQLVQICSTGKQRQNNIWCLPPDEIKAREEQIVHYLILYRQFDVERQRTTAYSRAYEPPRGPRGGALSVTPVVNNR